MSLHIIVGTQWGDEGKGRIVDSCAENSHFTARFNGGDNAGHTVTVGEQIFKLHLIPSGIIHPHIVAVMGNGMVINPSSLLEEMDLLRRAGIDVTPERLRISHAAHLITPAHRELDRVMEGQRGKDSLGTTGRGIGPAYMDKASRRGLRMADMLSPDFVELLGTNLAQVNRTLEQSSAPALEIKPVLDAYKDYASRLRPYIVDIRGELLEALEAGHTITAEGAQGTLLDIDHGTYPFVTSSSTYAPSALTGLGLNMKAARDARVTGVAKAFQTRVGSGPFPTEIFGDLAGRMRGTGEQPWDEYGTTTGRPRRVGWLDGVLLNYASRLNGLTDLAVTKLDVLSGFEVIRLCTAYRRGGKTWTSLAFNQADLNEYEPVYEEYPGWEENITGCRSRAELPAAAQAYLTRIAELAGVPVRMVSVGPERQQLIIE